MPTLTAHGVQYVQPASGPQAPRSQPIWRTGAMPSSIMESAEVESTPAQTRAMNKKMHDLKLAVVFSIPDDNGRARQYKAIGTLYVDSALNFRAKIAKVYDQSNGGEVRDFVGTPVENTALNMLQREYNKKATTYVWAEMTDLAVKVAADRYAKEDGFETGRDGSNQRRLDGIKLAKFISGFNNILLGGFTPPAQMLRNEDIRLAANKGKVLEVLKTIANALKGIKGSFYEGLNGEINSVLKLVGTHRDRQGSASEYRGSDGDAGPAVSIFDGPDDDDYGDVDDDAPEEDGP